MNQHEYEEDISENLGRVLARHRHSYLSLSQTQAVLPLLSCFISHLIVSEPNKYA